MSAPLPPPPESSEPDVLDEKTMVDKARRKVLTVDELKQYIAAGKDVNYQDEEGRTALIRLMETASDCQTDLIQMLLDVNADVNMQSNDGVTALHYAADYNHPAAIAQLIEARADVNIQTTNGVTALLIASHFGNMACILPLLDAKANFCIENGNGVTPMSVCLRRHHSNDDMMRLLLKHGTCQDTGFTALMEASRRGYVLAVKKLLALGANVYEKDKYGTTALDVTYSEECTMLLAPESPQPIDEKMMVKKTWCNKLTVDELKQYIAAGNDVNYQNKPGRTALMLTARHGQTELTQMLLDANADMNMQDNDGRAALHYAADYNHPTIIVQLIKTRADVNMQDNVGWTALHEALNYGHMACTLLLLDAEANLWLENNFRETPMSLGLQEQPSNDDMMRFCIEHGTCQDTGFTALMEASRRGYVPAVTRLLALGANVYEKDKYGTTALDVASSEECTMLLRQHTMMSDPLPPPPESSEPDVLCEETMVEKARRNKLTVDELKQYIAAGKDVNYQNEDGSTALMWTAFNGQTELTQMVLDVNAAVNMQNDDGWTALHFAAVHDQPAAIAQLIEAGSDVNMQKNDGDTALHWALNYRHMACTYLLLGAKTNLWLENNYRETPMSLCLLSHHRNDEMMRFLLKHGTCQDTGFTALMEASRRGYVRAVEKLLALGANVHEKDKYGTTALDVASSEECAMLLRQHTMMSAPLPPPPESSEPDVLCEETMVEKARRNKLTVDELKQYIAAGKDVNYQNEDGRTALMFTAGNGKTELIQMLLDANADVNMHNNDGYTALHWVLSPGYSRTYASLLLDAKANLWLEDGNGKTPMSYGLQNRHSNDDMMRLLLEHGTCQDTGFSALMEAARQGYVPAVKRLLALGANVYEKDKYGTTALAVASSEECTMLLRQHTMMFSPLPPPPESSEPDVLDGDTMIEKASNNKLTVDELKQYIAAGKDVNYRDGYGNTALIETAQHGQTELTQMLLDANADVNRQNNYGWTALHDAADKNQPAVMAQLIKAGADVNIQDIGGETALRYAISFGSKACASLLLDAKANLWLKNRRGQTHMSLGLQRQHTNDDMTRFLLEHGPCKDTGFTALMEASHQGNVPALKRLLALGANFYEKDKYGTTALDVASSEECAMLLRQHMIMFSPLPPPPESPEQDVLDEETMVDKARRNELTVDELKQYIATGKEVNYQNDKNGRTVLMETARHGQTDLTQMLLDVNADVNMQDNDGWTVLHYAAVHNQPAAIAQLIEARADVNMQNNRGYTALHKALNFSQMACTLLLDAEANLWLEDGSGKTPMSLCLLRHHHSNDDMMRRLLKHGTCQDTGFTALMEASRRGYVTAVTRLLALGANVYEKDKYGTTALDVTYSEECTMLLRQHTIDRPN